MMNDAERQAAIKEGENRALYLLLVIGDENVAHDHFHPDKAHSLFEVRKDIVRRLELDAPYYPSLGGNWPTEYPDFKTYSYTLG
ncbi:MAG: hypothetical protein ACUZ8A_06390 [Candidatus Bathyanammoxibius sp.]